MKKGISDILLKIILVLAFLIMAIILVKIFAGQSGGLLNKFFSIFPGN